jgi:sulfur-carrier protein
MIRVQLPAHLRTLAKVDREVTVTVDGPVTQRSVLDALEASYPVLRGAIRDRDTGKRRSLVRFYACQQDFSNESPDALLPYEVAAGTQPFMVVGAMAGGATDAWPLAQLDAPPVMNQFALARTATGQPDLGEQSKRGDHGN